MRKFLYGKWFFFFLALVCLLDLITDLINHGEWSSLDVTAIVLDSIALGLTSWMFGDLHRRRPKHGRGPRG